MGHVRGGGIFFRELVCVPGLMSTVRCVYVSVTFLQQFYVEGVEVTRPLYAKVACDVLGDMQHNSGFVPPVHLLCIMSDLCFIYY